MRLAQLVWPLCGAIAACGTNSDPDGGGLSLATGGESQGADSTDVSSVPGGTGGLSQGPATGGAAGSCLGFTGAPTVGLKELTELVHGLAE